MPRVTVPAGLPSPHIMFGLPPLCPFHFPQMSEPPWVTLQPEPGLLNETVLQARVLTVGGACMHAVQVRVRQYAPAPPRLCVQY